MPNTFGKSQRLKSKKDIDYLFASGIRINNFPIQLIYSIIKQPEAINIKAGFVAPKKKQSTAVARNLIKRRMVHAFRQNKSQLEEFAKSKAIGINLFFIYQSKEIENFHKMEEKIILILAKLLNDCKK